VGAGWRAAQLVAHVLGGDRHVQAAGLQAGADALLEHPAQIQLGQSHVAIGIPFHSGQRGGIELLGQALGQDRHALLAPLCPPLDDCRLQHVGQAAEGDLRLSELLRDNRQGRARRAADAEREVPGVAAHDRHEEPPLGRGGILHQVANQILAEVARGGEPERNDVARQGEIVVDGFGHMRHRQAIERPRQSGRGERRVVPADRDQVIDAQALEGLGDLRDAVRRRRRVRPGSTDDGAAVEVDAGGVVDPKLGDVLGIASDKPLEAVVAPEDLQALVAGLDGGGRNDRVDAGRRAAADQDAECLHRSLRAYLTRGQTVAASFV
jgi:hypothetical protein